MRLKRIVALLLLLVFTISPLNTFADLKVDGIDYVRPQNANVGFGGNVWHDNFTKGTAVFPLAEAWKSENIGLSNGQPIIIDDLVFVLANKKIVALDKATGSKLADYNVQTIYPNFTNGNLFALRSSKDQYILLIPSKDGEILSLTANIARQTNEKNEEVINKVSITKNWTWNIKNLSNQKDISTNIITTDVTILKDKNLNRVYMGFGTYSGQLIVLDVETGNALTNTNVEFKGTLGSGSGVVYKDFATIIMPQNKDKGSLIGGTVINGVFHLDKSLPEEIHTEGLAGPTAYGIIENPIYNELTGMLLIQDNQGTIIAYDTTYNEVLFKIDKFQGYKTLNGFSIAGNYILATFGEGVNNKAKIVAIDHKRAIQLAQPRPDLKGNGAIIFEQDLNAQAYNGAIALTIAEQNKDDYGNIQEVISRELFLIGNRKSENSIQMFYLDQYNASSNKPIPVPYGFKVQSGEGVYSTKSSLNIPGGITTPLSYAGGYLIFGDSAGNIHAYTAIKEKNLGLLNLDNSEDKLTKGETYVAKVDVVNYTGEHQRNIPMEFFIDDKLVHSSLIEIPEDGLTVNFQYTVPKDYKNEKLVIESKVNMKEPRSLSEVTYGDNVLKVSLEVKKDLIDVEARELTSNSPVSSNLPQTSSVKIVNHSEVRLENVLVWYRVAGRNVKTERITLGPKETVVKTYQWTTPSYSSNVTLSVVVDPQREIADINRNNNTTTKTVKVNKSSFNNTTTCSNGVATGTFAVDYYWLDEIRVHRETDEEGNVYRWEEEIWKYQLVPYKETMVSKVSINTNQQDPNSRGGWEIIPYAKKERIDANKVTRSGYGIEVKVDVSYSVSPGWEALPSPKATPYGPNYLNRLKGVRVYANLPNGQRVQMVRTRSSDNNVTFELPEISYTPAGIRETWKGRFFSMPARTPDGKYPFTIEIVGGGQNDLSCIVKDEIYIYGDVFRDTNIQRNR